MVVRGAQSLVSPSQCSNIVHANTKYWHSHSSSGIEITIVQPYH